jgi:hypothetical protein
VASNPQLSPFTPPAPLPQGPRPQYYRPGLIPIPLPAGPPEPPAYPPGFAPQWHPQVPFPPGLPVPRGNPPPVGWLSSPQPVSSVSPPSIRWGPSISVWLQWRQLGYPYQVVWQPWRLVGGHLGYPLYCLRPRPFAGRSSQLPKALAENRGSSRS